jgi:DNA-binding IclR family transcriptional regulator
MVNTNTPALADKQDKAQSGQLERAFAVIHALTNSLFPMKLNALAEVAGLDPSGTLRLLKTLSELGYVMRDDARKAYFPSPRALFPLSMFHPLDELRRDAAEPLLRILRETTATSALQAFICGQRVVVEHCAGSNRLSPYVDHTVNSLLHSSASGKVLLSTMDGAERRALLGDGPFPQSTPHTLTTWAQLDADIERGVERGFFTVVEEAMLGMSAIAAPLKLPNGSVVGCLVAFGTTAQLPLTLMPERGLVVCQAADMLKSMSPALRALEPLLMRSPKLAASALE